jgi:hypothetical protein
MLSLHQSGKHSLADLMTPKRVICKFGGEYIKYDVHKLGELMING